jgi:5-hydroxyisourate hydrolase
MGRLSTHVLDTSIGRPAAGVRILLHRIDAQYRVQLVDTLTNADGRTDKPLLTGDELEAARYELEFHAGDYFRERGVALSDPAFVDVVPIRFGIADVAGHYHVPLLMTPWSYSTYRGS